MTVNITSGQELVTNNALSVSIQVSSAKNLVKRNVGNYTESYLSQIETTTTTLIMEPNQTYEGPATNILVLNCEYPVLVTTTDEDDTIVEINVTKLLVLDNKLKSFSLTNSPQKQEISVSFTSV